MPETTPVVTSTIPWVPAPILDDPLYDEVNPGVWGSMPARVSVWSENLADSPFRGAILGGAKNAFTQENTVEREADQVKKAIRQFETFLAVPYKSVLTRNLFALFDSAKEDDPSSLGIEIGSLHSFFRFVQLYPTLRIPAISLTPEYHIYISWKLAKNKLFSVRFLPNGDARFVAFTQNKLHPNKINRLYGTTTADLIMQTIKAYDIFDWILDEG
jgi:hypothetical protein